MKQLALIAIGFLMTIAFAETKAQIPNWIWAHCPKASIHGEGEGKKMALDIQNNSYIVGDFNDTLIFGNDSIKEANGATAYIAKYNSQGVPQWARCPSGNISYGYNVATDIYNNVYFIGDFMDSIRFGADTLVSSGYLDMFLVKYDSNGNVIWARKAGGINGDGSGAVATDSIGNVYVTGVFSSPTITFNSTTINNSGGRNLFLAKYDSSGNIIWVKQGIGPDASGALISIDVNNNIYVGGTFSSNNHIFGNDTLILQGQTDFFILKYDETGNNIWARALGGTGREDPEGLTTNRSGEIFITGNYDSPDLFVGADTLHNTGVFNTFLIKYRSVGAPVWAKSSICTGGVTSWSIVTDDCINCIGGETPCGTIYISGSIVSANSQVQFDSDTITSSSSGEVNSFIEAFNSNGTAIGGIVVPFGGDDWNAIAIDATKNLYFGGDIECIQDYFLGNDTIGCTWGEAPFMSMLNFDIPCLTNITPVNAANGFSIYPNPSSGLFYIHSKQPITKTEIFNYAGQKVFELVFGASSASASEVEIDLSAAAAGIYFYSVMLKDGTVASGKMVKE